MKAGDPKADLTLLKRYIDELEKELNAAYKLRDEAHISGELKLSYQDFMLALSKAIGILSGINTESGLLIGDVYKIAKYSEPKSLSSNEDEPSNMIDNLLNFTKNHKNN